MTTPLRQLDVASRDGVRLLSDMGLDYADGAEHELVPILRESADLTSLSHQLESVAQGWAQTYHLTKSRPNLFRGMEVDASSTILEIGAGCGAVTRWLGEQGAAVDAVEPMFDRALANRLRTRDLPNVEVFAGGVEDVPEEAAYDIVAIVGVLEYVGGGGADLSPYQDFLGRAVRLLRPDGVLLLAIENRLGVKYLAGAPEDHLGRPFVGVEGYREPGVARTFTRPELEDLVRDAGLESVRFLQAFPDYKLTRTLMADELINNDDPDVRALAWHLPKFPSPDWTTPRARGLDEGPTWRTFVEADVAGTFGNSFVLVARADATGSTPWPDDHLAVFHSTSRRPAFCCTTAVRQSSAGVTFERTPLQDESEVIEGDLKWVATGSTHRPGPVLLDLLVDRSQPEEMATLLGAWLGRLEAAITEAGDAWLPLDLVPSNLVVDPTSGELGGFDQEWFVRGWSVEELVTRGLVQTGFDLADRTTPARWQGGSVGSIALELGSLIGLGEETTWLAQAVMREAAFQVQVSQVGPFDPTFAERCKAMADGYVRMLQAPLASRSGGVRDWETLAAMRAQAQAAPGYQF